MQGVRDALLGFTIKFECLEKHLERRIDQQIEKLEQKLHKTEAKLHSAVRHCMAELMKHQTHLQRKQDQLAAKQDLLHTTIVHDQCPLPPSIMTSPPPSVQPSHSSHQDIFRSPSAVREILTEEDGEIDEILSYLSGESGTVEQSRSRCSELPHQSSLVAVDRNGGSAPSTSLLAEKQKGPAHFADLISSLQATEQDCESRISVSLTTQPRSGGPASSADLTSSVPAGNEACELPVNITSHFQVTIPSGGQAPSASSFCIPEQPRPAVKLASTFPAPVQSGGIAPFASSFPAAEQPRPAVKLASTFPDPVQSGGIAPFASSFPAAEQPKRAVKLASPLPVPVQSGGPAPSAYTTSSFLAGCGPMDLDTFMATELDKEMMDPTASSTVSERSDPSCSKLRLRTSSFELPNMLKSADTVMEENKSLWTLSGVGKLAIRLARQSFFGDSVLMSSTVTGKDRPALDPVKMASLYDIIQKNVFKSTSVHEFEKNIIPRINSAVAGICKRLRST